MSYKTNLTHNKREQLKSQMDDFATFQWRGRDMWEEYGCFIINESKGSLKFYNGPGYSNKYAKSQFSSSVNTLIGVDFKQKTIPMKIGMYWFTIAEYQEFLNDMGPYVVNYLTFGYNKKYSYLVKLANMQDSVRHIVGTNESGEYCYYTEMDIVWELLGDNCVRSNLPYEYQCNISSNKIEWTMQTTNADMTDDSLLDTPIMFEIPLSFSDSNATLELQAKYSSHESPIQLFKIRLKNLIANSTTTTSTINNSNNSIVNFWDQDSNIYQMLLRYDSETGLIYLQEGSNSTWHLLNFQTNTTNGDYLLDAESVIKWKIPGTLFNSDMSVSNWKFTLITTNVSFSNVTNDVLATSITSYARKNIV